jgi:hypothetical protein
VAGLPYERHALDGGKVHRRHPHEIHPARQRRPVEHDRVRAGPGLPVREHGDAAAEEVEHLHRHVGNLGQMDR